MHTQKLLPKFNGAWMVLLGILLFSTMAQAGEKNGFELSDSLIPEKQILQGGPPRDGIPAIHKPVFINASQAGYLSDSDRILGVQFEGQAKAYPIRILNWHEVVNDKINESDFSITYCPLCGTGVAFSGTTQTSGIQFGVSGLLYNSDVLLYDLATQSLWSQILGQAISGERMGEKLVKIPLQHTNWKHWQALHPDTLVLSDDTGFSRDYERDPYSGYGTSSTIYFPTTENPPDQYHPKEQVIGLEADDQFIAFPFVELNKNTSTSIKGELNGQAYLLNWNKEQQSARVTDNQGNELAVIQAFWFAWYTFHPETAVFTADK